VTGLDEQRGASTAGKSTRGGGQLPAGDATRSVPPRLVTEAVAALAPSVGQDTAVRAALVLHRAGMLRPRPSRGQYRLTQQQRQILIGGARGESVEGTAQRLGRSYDTIRSHRRALFRNLRVDGGMTEAVTVALVAGLITLDEILPAEHPALARLRGEGPR
jgi:DNA-binding NarL/FixJ family response regulator